MTLALTAMTPTHWATARAWRTAPWATPRLEEDDARLGASPDAEWTWYACYDGPSFVGVAAHGPVSDVPFSLAKLLDERAAQIAVIPSIQRADRLFAMADAIVIDAFTQRGASTVVGRCAVDVESLVDAWRWIVDRLTRERAIAHAASCWIAKDDNCCCWQIVRVRS